jgi:hypothetical protein
VGVSFLTPLFLAGFIGILVPIIIHLIRRYRGKIIPFPSLMFLRKLPLRRFAAARSGTRSFSSFGSARSS